MPTTATKATKTSSLGSEGMLILEPGVAFTRKTNFQSAWTHIRLGYIWSLTDLTGVNNNAPEEVVSTIGGNPRTRFFVGMSNGVGAIGDAGNRFVGLSSDPASNFSSTGNNGAGPASQFGNSLFNSEVYMKSVIADGSSLTYNGSSAQHTPKFSTTIASTSFCGGFALDFDVSTAGKLTMASCRINNFNDASDQTLINLITTFPSSDNYGDITGGWWGSNPVDCLYPYIRLPLLTNRLRIHNIMAINFVP